jgi:phage replication O-like protein O
VANPQLEDGHVRIVNEVFEALCRVQLTGNEFRVVLALIRKTWGWRKKADAVSCSQLQVLTHIRHRVTVWQALKRAEIAKIIIGEHRDRKPTIYRLNKNYEEWQLLAPALTDKAGHLLAPGLTDYKPARIQPVSLQANRTVSLQATHNSTLERHSEKDTHEKTAEGRDAPTPDSFNSHPVGKAYRELFYPLGIPQNELRPGWRAICILKTHPVYTDTRAINALKKWKATEYDREDRNPFAWIAAALWDTMSKSEHADGLPPIPKWKEAKAAWNAKAEVTA